MRAVEFARHHELEVAVRAGGHSHLAWGSSNGLVIDLSPLKQIRIDADRRRPQPLDLQPHQPVVRQHVGPADLDHFLDRLRQERAAAAEERQVDAADLLHHSGAALVEPSLAADGVPLEAGDQPRHERVEARARGRVDVQHLEAAVARLAAVAAEVEQRDAGQVHRHRLDAVEAAEQALVGRHAGGDDDLAVDDDQVAGVQGARLVGRDGEGQAVGADGHGFTR